MDTRPDSNQPTRNRERAGTSAPTGDSELWPRPALGAQWGRGALKGALQHWFCSLQWAPRAVSGQYTCCFPSLGSITSSAEGLPSSTPMHPPQPPGLARPAGPVHPDPPQQPHAGVGLAEAPQTPPLALWGGRPRAAQRAPRTLDKALPVPEGPLQPRSRISGSSRNRSGSPTPELAGASLTPGHSQAWGGATLEPRGDRDRLDIAPPSGSSLSTRATAGQRSAPMLPSTDALPQASAARGGVSGPGALSPATLQHTPQLQEGPGHLGCSCSNAQGGAVPEGQAPQAYVPTPRTEEAAWAASALTFLLVVLTLAVLYTRLHRKFHKNQSLYWAPSDAGQEPLAALLKRRLLAAHSRHKKRQRPQQRRLLLQGPSSESSD
ncbi:tumor protein p53-inducible protein 13 isoform X1 [Gopherus evgoodei]|uniref:Tumor protein p53 inducible protein 13 n=1 Tax=Gopherus evgoodei TaxID=1825980 RepID=A0A8C4W522_9SAUR|nr:tumor protein p53-inducible protein 13 isoform X1 [Gopherus evgoodei]